MVSCFPQNDPTEEEIDVSSIPPAYYDFAPVFSKQRTLSLPIHRPYDCFIDLLPGIPLPVSQLYNLSGPKRESMKKDINESLDSGIIRPSTSLVGAVSLEVTSNAGQNVGALMWEEWKFKLQ